MAIAIAPFLLSWQEIVDLRAAWSEAIEHGLTLANSNVKRAIRAGVARPGKPEEADYVYGIIQSVVDAMPYELDRRFVRQGVDVAVAGVFCHQSPYVEFDVQTSSGFRRKRCELGDLLVVVRYQGKSGTEHRALLLQFKTKDWPGENPTKPQWRLYTEWPPFRWSSRPHFQRIPRPDAAHAGALYALIPGDLSSPLARPADPRAHPRKLATILNGMTMLFGGRPIKPRALARAEAGAGWSEIVWDLVDATAELVFTRKRSGAKRKRGFDTELLLATDSAIPSPLLEPLIAAGVSDDELNAIGADSEEPPPPDRPVRTYAADDLPDEGAISLLIIELSEAD